MPGKTKESEEKVKVLKGQEAEDLVLKYMQEVNRPYGAIDVAANLKGVVAKVNVQKILTSLSEKGSITQKVVGKSSFFVATQTNLDTVPKEQLLEMEENCKKLDEEVKTLQSQVKATQQELNSTKATPTDAELDGVVKEHESEVDTLETQLQPLRDGVQLISAEELEQVDAEWVKWRAEWINRRKIGKEAWGLFTDELPPDQSQELAEELGVEADSEEHRLLEGGPLCNTRSGNQLKRKYDQKSG